MQQIVAPQSLPTRLSQVMEDKGLSFHREIDAIDADLLSHIQDRAAKLQKEKVKKQQKHLLETACAMKSLKYAISALQKECSDAVVPECGALTSYRARRNGLRQRNVETQTETVAERIDSPPTETVPSEPLTATGENLPGNQ